MATIIETRVKADTRPAGRAGIVIADHVWSDGMVWQTAFELGPDDDMTARLQELTLRAQAQRLADEPEGGA